MMFYISFIQVNIVPVIAKADTLTQEECTKFKKQVPLAGTLVLWRNFNLELIKINYRLITLTCVHGFTCVVNFHLTDTAMNLLFLFDSLLERHLSILPVTKVSVLERVNSTCT